MLLQMENDSRTRMLDAALELLGTGGAASLTVRAVEDAAGLPHGSVRHHFDDRSGLVASLFDRLADREQPGIDRDAIATLGQWLGPGRTLTLARYELFLMAARDPALREPLVRARDRFVAIAADQLGAIEAPTLVAAMDGVVLDALVRGVDDEDHLRGALARILGSTALGGRPA